MSLHLNSLRGVFAALSLSVVLSIPVLASAQDRGHGQAGKTNHAAKARPAQRTQPSRGRTSAARTRPANTHSSGTHVARSSAPARTATRTSTPARSASYHQAPSTQHSTTSSSRAQVIAGHRQTESTWRAGHPSWNGHLYYHGGGYYFDSSYTYPAVVTNEWSTIAEISGGIALLGALSHDPTLYFAGTAGAFYSISRYDEDRYGSPTARLRYAYFNRPYFWRDGVEFVRISVTLHGHHGYEFRRG